jgi:hypothetical protein
MGYTSLPLTVQCSAELQMANADVMFVLDTTGSMGCNTSGSNCVSGSDSKIVGLRNAIKSFYTTVAGAVTDKANTRIRFGFVPYAMTVNASGLLTSGSMPSNYFVDSSPYITKLVQFSTSPTYIGTTGSPTATTETYSSNITQTNCNNYGVNKFPSSGSNPVTSGTAPSNATTTTYSYRSWTQKSGSGTSALGTCVRNKSVTVTTYQTRYLATSYRYTSSMVNVSRFKGFANVYLPTITLYNGSNTSSATYVSVQPSASNPYYNLIDLISGTPATGAVGNNQPAPSPVVWGGCIEERGTVPQLSMSPIPSGAYDMDVASAPITDGTNDATRWKPYLESLEFFLNGNSMPLNTSTAMSNQTGYCPQTMMLYTTVDTTAPNTVPGWLNTYVNSLVANGGTYHDIGMIWGARLGNPNGIFATNVNAGNLPSVSRHIIFMTDGTMENYPANYTAWGQTMYDGRDAPTSTSSTDLVNYHNNRFLAACTMAKNMGYTIWVIGFGQTLTTPMQSCATAGRAYYASNTTALTTTFQYIAGQVADLRLNK